MKFFLLGFILFFSIHCQSEEQVKRKELRREELLKEFSFVLGFIAPYKSNYEIFMDDLAKYIEKNYLKNEAFKKKWQIETDTIMQWFGEHETPSNSKYGICVAEATAIEDTCFYRLHFWKLREDSIRKNYDIIHHLIIVCNPITYEIYREEFQFLQNCKFDYTFLYTYIPNAKKDKLRSVNISHHTFYSKHYMKKELNYIPYGLINDELNLKEMHRRPEFKHYHYTCEDYGKKIFTWYKSPK